MPSEQNLTEVMLGKIWKPIRAIQFFLIVLKIQVFKLKIQDAILKIQVFKRKLCYAILKIHVNKLKIQDTMLKIEHRLN